ncbi:MAG TPA: glutamine synthetase family protein [Candidatus Dormibacteraeota bacterium]|jgi:glutamine synthetase|nr:glutamine synthetase family protein [Candidatus Dormibacteraeota bacterium]
MSSRSAATDAAGARDLTSRLADAGVRNVHLQFSDVLGTVKTVTIPASGLDAALEHGVWFDGSSVEGFTRTAESDMYLAPDPATLQVIPWAAEPTARLICWARTPDGEPYSGDPRGALQRAVDRAANLGYDYRVGPEIEFFLLERGPEGIPVARSDDGAGYFDVTGVGATDLRQAMLAAAAAVGVEVNSAHHEVAPGQHEVDLGAGAALAAADAVVTFRLAMQAVAQRAGLIASFMPKPFNDQPGSGMHVHQSLGRGGGNAFAGADDYGLSDVAKHFIAGQLHHAAGMCLVLAPLVNSYKRLVRGLEAPIFLSWARTNRGALIRVPHVSRTQAARVELRSPDPSCNPYLAFAVMLRCGLDGIERRLPLPPPVEEALYGFDEVELERRNVGLLPDNLKDAVDACADDDVVRDALGDNLTDRFLEAKRAEWREYRGQVTGWELERYLERA